MSNHKCCKNQSSTFQVRQRYIPTFVHQPIFDEEAFIPHSLRCTPTFLSTALNNEGYNIKTINKSRQKPTSRPVTAGIQKTIYANYTHEKRIQDLNPHYHVFCNSKDNWFDHTKQQMLNSIVNCSNRGYSKERKYLDLSSDPVFTDFQYQNNSSKYYGKNYELVVQQNPSGQTHIRNIQCDNKQIKSQQRQDYIQDETQTLDIQNKNPILIASPIKQQKANQEKIITATKNAAKSQKQKKDYHKNCIAARCKQQTHKTNKISQRIRSAPKTRVICQKPTFTVIRKNRIPAF